MKKETQKTYKVIMEGGEVLPRLTEAYIKSEYYKDNDFKHLPPMAKGGLADMFNDNADFFGWIAEAQQEVDVAYYQPLLKQAQEQIDYISVQQEALSSKLDDVELAIEQARKEVAREIFKEFEKHKTTGGLSPRFDKFCVVMADRQLQSLKDKFQGG